MCNACGFVCCASDVFSGCGCDGCDCEDCWSDDDADGPDCDHEDYEADILTGIATCGRCNHRWMQTASEIERERLHAAEYDKRCAEWDMQPEWHPGDPVLPDDGIPF